MHEHACMVCLCVGCVGVLRGHMHVLASWLVVVYMYWHTCIHVHFVYICVECLRVIVYTRVSWPMIRVCLDVYVYMNTYARCLHMYGVRAGYVRRESGLCVYIFVPFTTNSWMSLHALHALFINILWITWLLTTQTYVCGIRMCLVRLMYLYPIINLLHSADAEMCAYTLLLPPPSLSFSLVFSMYSTTHIYACMSVCA